MMNRRHTLAALAALGAAPAAFAQTRYLDRPVKLVCGYAPGGSVDATARIAADMLHARLGSTFVIDTLTGAAGTLAAQRVVQSPADGATLLLGSSNELAATRQVNPAQKYDTVKDLSPVALVATSPVVLVAAPHTGVRSLDEFVAKLKASPGKFSYGSSGVGSTLHFAGEMVKQRARLFMVHIPYRGTAPLTNDLVGGALDFAMMSPTSAAPFIQSGRIVPLAVTSPTRFAALPQVPAFHEHALFKGLELVGWYALAAPRGLADEQVRALRGALQAGLADPAFRQRLEAAGATPATGREDLAALMREDAAKYAALVKVANFRD